MHEPAAVTLADTVVAFARWSDAVDALCSAIAGFALLANTRAFAFTALLAWREPVLGGLGLVLLAALGWLRWQCGGRAAAHDTHAGRVTRAGRVTHAAHAMHTGRDTCTARASQPVPNAGNESRAVMRDDPAHALPVGAGRALVACYNRSSESESKRRAARVGPCSSSGAWPYAGAQVKRPQRSLCVIRT
ncbi:hypothetical protein [Paraburkholderia bryophila]|jgi:hypothetical protein|uniref:Uncharacterized protein n=1 Tax=Paraburkholderia bryophila TaxID=420952 RepID=A0A329CKA3_9BURK|nr:hypothetical protein [Paraburkholderia bryophila]RAS34517.1 hypothetical protein BX591_106198 [Paraburkholderia bryophila]